MSEIKMQSLTWMAKCNQLTPLPFKGLKSKGCGTPHDKVAYTYPYLLKITPMADTVGTASSL